MTQKEWLSIGYEKGIINQEEYDEIIIKRDINGNKGSQSQEEVYF